MEAAAQQLLWKRGHSVLEKDKNKMMLDHSYIDVLYYHYVQQQVHNNSNGTVKLASTDQLPPINNEIVFIHGQVLPNHDVLLR